MRIQRSDIGIFSKSPGFKNLINKKNFFENAMSFNGKDKNSLFLPSTKKPEESNAFSSISEMGKAMAEESKMVRILKKIAKGQALTAEETAYLEKIAPEKIKMAKMAYQRKKEIEHSLKNAKSAKQAETIIAGAKQEAAIALAGGGKDNPLIKIYGECLSEAVSEVEKEYKKDKKLNKEE